MQIRPSLCEVSGRDTVDSILDALAEIMPRPVRLLQSAVLPAVAVFLLSYMQTLPQIESWFDTIWGIAGAWLVQSAAFLPCVLAWSRIGFYSGLDSQPLKLWDTRGIVRGLDLLGIGLLTIFAVAVGVNLLLRGMIADGQIVFPAHWILVFAAAVVIIPALILGGMRLLVTLPAAALGWSLSYRDALILTQERSGWLAGLGVAFVCMFPLTWQGVAGLRGMVLANVAVPDVVWPWVSFLFTALLCAVAGHGLGHILRRLLDGIPDEDEQESSKTQAKG